MTKVGNAVWDRETGVEIAPSNRKACAHCPWRISNQGKRHPHGFYSKKNLARLWAGLRRGERMTCHPTDPRMAEFEGYEGTADAPIVRECAGSLLVKAREWNLLNDLAKQADDEGTNAFKLYRERRPRGMTKGGLFVMAQDLMFSGRTALGGLLMRREFEDDSDVGYPWIDGA